MWKKAGGSGAITTGVIADYAGRQTIGLLSGSTPCIQPETNCRDYGVDSVGNLSYRNGTGVTVVSGTLGTCWWQTGTVARCSDGSNLYYISHVGIMLNSVMYYWAN